MTTTATARARSQAVGEPATDASDRMNRHARLYRGVKSILRCDEAAVVQNIARYVVEQHRSLRFLSGLIERTQRTAIPGVVALIGWLRAYLSVRSPERGDGYVWIARLSNERRAIEALMSHDRTSDWIELRFSSWPEPGVWLRLIKNLAPRRVFKLVRRLQRRHEFFKVLRVVELIAYYTRYEEIFRAHRFKAAITSNHSNPHGIAFNLAAKKLSVPVILVAHGMPIRPVARLSYDLAILHCEAAREAYLAEGCEINRVLVRGRQKDFVPMSNGPLPKRVAIGIFLCKDVNAVQVKNLIERLLRRPDVSQILLRPHPKNLWSGLREWVGTQDPARLRLSEEAAPINDAKSVDLVLAGNSSVLVEAVIAGRPAAYVCGLDHAPNDLHRFVERGLIHAPDIELIEDWDSAPMQAFYQRPEWLEVLRCFANIDESEPVVMKSALKIVAEFAGR